MVFLLPFQFGCLIYFSFLTAVAGTSNIMVNKNRKCRHPCLVPDLNGKAFGFLPLSMILIVGLPFMAFIRLKYISSIPLLRVFITDGYWNFIKCFLRMYSDGHMIFISHYVNVMYHTDGFTDVEPFLHTWNISYLITVFNSFNALLNPVC